MSACALVAALGSASAAWAQAQSPDPPPPIKQSVDANGVDVISGALVLSAPQASIGQSGHQLTRQYQDFLTRDNNYGAINSSGTTYTVSVGAGSETFTRSGNSFTSQQGTASILTIDGTGEFYTYYTSDGSAFTFDTAYGGNGGAQANVARIRRSSTPVGETIYYNYDFYCSNSLSLCQETGPNAYRLSTVSSNRGYSLSYNYLTNAGAGAQNLVSLQTSNYSACLAASSACGVLATTGVSGTSSTDPMNRTTSYGGFAASATQIITLPSSLTRTITYDSSSRVISYATAAGAWGYSYSDSGPVRTTTVTDSNNNQQTYVSNTSLDVLTGYTDGMGRKVDYAIDGYGRVTAVTNSTGDQIQYLYDGRGNITQTTRIPRLGSGQMNIITTANFDETCNQLSKCNKPNSTIDGAGAETEYTYDSNTGALLTVTRPAGANGVRPQTRYTYSWLLAGGQSDYISLLTGISSCATGSAPSCVGTADETVVTIAYDPNQNLAPVSVTKAAGDGSVRSTVSFSYDAVGNLQFATSPLQATMRLRYDADRELVGQVSADPDGSGPLTPAATRITYDVDGNVTQTEQGTVASQSDADWVNFSSSTQQGYVYDGAGRRIQTWENGGGVISGTTQYSYDGANRLICTAVRMNPSAFSSLPASPCILGATGVDGPDRVTLNSYNAADELTQSVSSFATPSARSDVSVTYADVPGAQLPATLTDANGNVTTYSYDGFNRPSTIWYPQASNGAQNTGDFEAFSYGANSNVVSKRQRDGSTLNYAYDAFGRITTGPDGATYAYDNMGKMLTAAYGGRSTSITYDALGRRTTQSSPWGTVSTGYDAAGNRTWLSWPDGFTVSYDHDILGRLTAARESGAISGPGLLANIYYDNLGRRNYASGGAGLVATGYAYDALSRLGTISYNFANDAGHNAYIGLNYNAADQIKLKTNTNDLYDWADSYGAFQTYGVNHLNQVASGGATYGYNAKGALTSDGVSTYNYDGVNRLSSVSSSVPGVGANLYYDGLERVLCSQPSSGTTCFLYDGTDLIAEYNGTGPQLLRRYVPSDKPDDPLVWYEGAGTTDRRYLMKDQQGTVIAVANSSGQAMAINSYDAYGLPAEANQGRFQYTGQAWFPEIGLYNYKARMYSPTLGRFMQTDPAGYGAGMNWYNYVNGDPVNLIDPSGLEPQENDPNVRPIDGSQPSFSFPPITVRLGIPSIGPLSIPGVIQTALGGQSAGGSGRGSGQTTPQNIVKQVVVAAKRIYKPVCEFVVDHPDITDLSQYSGDVAVGLLSNKIGGTATNGTLTVIRNFSVRAARVGSVFRRGQAIAEAAEAGRIGGVVGAVAGVAIGVAFDRQITALKDQAKAGCGG